MGKTLVGKSNDNRDCIVFEKNVFHLHQNAKPAFSSFSGLKSVFEKLRFGDGLVWTAGLTIEVELRFQISPECSVDDALTTRYVVNFQLFSNMFLTVKCQE